MEERTFKEFGQFCKIQKDLFLKQAKVRLAGIPTKNALKFNGRLAYSKVSEL